MKTANIWIAFTSQALTAFKARRLAEQEGDTYTGPMDEETYKIMSLMQSSDNRQRLYKSPTIASKTYHLFSLDITGNLAAAKDAIDLVTDRWPDHIIMIGAWWFDTGLQAGTSYTYDEEGEVTGITGTPAYPIHSAAWRLMPDVITYNADGTVDTVTPATSNADLRDINLVAGQAPRIFT